MFLSSQIVVIFAIFKIDVIYQITFFFSKSFYLKDQA